MEVVRHAIFLYRRLSSVGKQETPMRHLRQICCLPAAIMLMSGTIHAEEPQLYDIPKVEAITIDGDDADWGDQGFRVEAMSIARGNHPT
jgi:hypothetical protein